MNEMARNSDKFDRFCKPPYEHQAEDSKTVSN
jgi:hypothetical protein